MVPKHGCGCISASSTCLPNTESIVQLQATMQKASDVGCRGGRWGRFFFVFFGGGSWTCQTQEPWLNLEHLCKIGVSVAWHWQCSDFGKRFAVVWQLQCCELAWLCIGLAVAKQRFGHGLAC